MEFDAYLSSSDALLQTESAQGAALHPDQVLDGMRVLAFLGRGATSEVWRVHDLKQDRDYALKIFAPPSDAPEQARQRFLTEARALDEFRHPNLMRRYRLQETGDHPYYTMEVLRPLPEQLNERSILSLFDDILSGLDALHAKGIVHRDLKPSNILLDDAGHAVLSDLGVAHVIDSNLAKRLGDTRTPDPTLAHGSPFVGTPRYAAPEQLTGDTITPAADLYSLGVVIEQLFGNKIPFRWRPLLRRMTAARPHQRLQSVRQVRRHLRVLRLAPRLLRMLLVIGIASIAAFTWHLAQPEWIELPDSFAEMRAKPQRLIITLQGGHYYQQDLRLKPLCGPAAEMRRCPVYIQGTGTLRCPDLAFCEIHLASGVTFITTGRFRPDGNAIKEPTPPSDADWTHRIGYPAFVIEKGAALVFTENDAYPSTLIRRE